MRALLVYPTHQNCIEAETTYVEAGVTAAAYPARVTLDDSGVAPNCWNQNADLAEAMGFSVMQAVCPACRVKQDCERTGYLRKVRDADRADVVLCTHQRAAYTGLHELSAQRQYVSVHENPLGLLRPRLDVSQADLNQVQMILDRMLNDPHFLDWFGDHLRVDDDGNRFEDQELAVRKDRQLEYTRLLSAMTDRLVTAIQAAEATVEWDSELRVVRPEGMDRTLFFAARVAGVTFAGQPWRFVLAAAAGALRHAVIIVTKRFHKGGGQEQHFQEKVAVGFRDNMPNPNTVTWFNDATTSVARLQAILGRHIQDRTPVGHLPLQRKAVQIVRDITRRTASRIVQNILRGVLVDRPQFQRVGVICHSPHVTAITSLEPEFARRIVKVAYFGSGDDRSSNDWYQQCDLIVVAGTPRLPPVAVASYLVQVGDLAAAFIEPKWGPIYWDGLSESGEPVSIKSSGYDDELWQRAHRDLVRAAIVQAVGRGRGILDTGCEVLVLSNEECGLPISDAGMETLNRTSVLVYDSLTRLSLPNANNNLLGKCSVSTTEIAQATSLDVSGVRKILVMLERRGRVAKVGERGGWRPIADCSPAQAVPSPLGDPSSSPGAPRDPPSQAGP